MHTLRNNIRAMWQSPDVEFRGTISLALLVGGMIGGFCALLATFGGAR